MKRSLGWRIDFARPRGEPASGRLRRPDPSRMIVATAIGPYVTCRRQVFEGWAPWRDPDSQPLFRKVLMICLALPVCGAADDATLDGEFPRRLASLERASVMVEDDVVWLMIRSIMSTRFISGPRQSIASPRHVFS